HAAFLRALADTLEGEKLVDAAVSVVEWGSPPALASSPAYLRAKARATQTPLARWRELTPFIVPVLAGLGFLVIALNTGGLPAATPPANAPSVVLTHLDGGVASQVRSGERLRVHVDS